MLNTVQMRFELGTSAISLGRYMNEEPYIKKVQKCHNMTFRIFKFYNNLFFIDPMIQFSLMILIEIEKIVISWTISSHGTRGEELLFKCSRV